ncbi:MAG: helix-turn-helix domain-containing protein [Firmicutes bacterium]|nr:helix-turn-helix domain-containing protein [Bacillota bacterium]
MTNAQIIGQKIKYFRRMNALTQKELAAEIGVAPSYIANIEQGQKRISLDKLVHICKRFNLGLSDLLPMEDAGDSDAKEKLIGEIADALRALEMTQISLIRTMVCALKENR